MVGQLEITKEDFKSEWTRFELVARAKERDKGKQLTIIPTLLCGKLLDTYVELPEESKRSIENLRKVLAEQADVMQDPLSVAKRFADLNQWRQEKVVDYADKLKRLFREAYPSEDVNSTMFI